MCPTSSSSVCDGEKIFPINIFNININNKLINFNKFPTSYKPFSVAVLCVCKCTATVFRKSIGFTNVLNLLVHEVSHATFNSDSPIKTQATHIWYDLSSPASPLTVGCPVNDHQIWKAGWAWPSVWKCCLPNSIGKLPFVSSASPRPWS